MRFSIYILDPDTGMRIHKFTHKVFAYSSRMAVEIVRKVYSFQPDTWPLKAVVENE